MSAPLFLRLRCKLSNLEKELSEANKRNAKLELKVEELSKKVEEQSLLLVAADKTSLYPIWPFQQLQDSQGLSASIKNNPIDAVRLDHDYFRSDIESLRWRTDYEIGVGEEEKRNCYKVKDEDEEEEFTDEDIEDSECQSSDLSTTSDSESMDACNMKIKLNHEMKAKRKLFKTRSHCFKKLQKFKNLSTSSVDKTRGRSAFVNQVRAVPSRSPKEMAIFDDPREKLPSFRQGLWNNIARIVEEVLNEYKDQDEVKSIRKYLSDNQIYDKDKQIKSLKEGQANSGAESTEQQGAEHINPKPEFKCNVCSKILRSSSTLKSHILDHEGNKPFLCLVCKKSFRLKTSLQRHQLIHEKKNQKCSECDKMFTTKGDLNKHALCMHAKKYKFFCSMCPMQFFDSSGFRRHERRHLGIKPHVCSECGRSFPELRNLRLHVNSVHSGKDNPYRLEVVI